MIARFAPFFVGFGINKLKLTRPSCVGHSGRFVILRLASEALYRVIRRAIMNHFYLKQGDSFLAQGPQPARFTQTIPKVFLRVPIFILIVVSQEYTGHPESWRSSFAPGLMRCQTLHYGGHPFHFSTHFLLIRRSRAKCLLVQLHMCWTHHRMFFVTLTTEHTLISVYTLMFQLINGRALLTHEGAWLLFLAARPPFPPEWRLASLEQICASAPTCWIQLSVFRIFSDRSSSS